ncbi:phage terminase small subunit [Xanthomonas sp. 60]
MADSPAKRHLTRARAAQAAAAAAPNQLMDGTTVYEQMLLQLASDKGRLKQIQSNVGKAALKADLLPAYDAYIDGVLGAGQGAQDQVLTTVMLWHIDAGNFAQALRIGQYVIAHKLSMPDSFSRTTGCVIAEEIADAALNAQKTDQPLDLAVLDQAATLTEAEDMPDQVRARLFLAKARGWLATGSKEEPPPYAVVLQAVSDLKRAITLQDSCGGKKDLEGAERLLKKLADALPTGAGEDIATKGEASTGAAGNDNA